MKVASVLVDWDLINVKQLHALTNIFYFLFGNNKSRKKTQTKLLFNELPNEKISYWDREMCPFRDVHVRDGRRFMSASAGWFDRHLAQSHTPSRFDNQQVRFFS